MERQVFDDYIRAGKVCAEIKDALMKKCRPGVRIIELAQLAEEMMEKEQVKPAFPLNISINEIAAHYTPTMGDAIEVKEGDLVKFDVGVHVNGYIADSAVTYCSEKSDLIDCVNSAIEKGIAAVRPGAVISDVAQAIESAVNDMGMGLIVNLTGHYLDRYVFHGAPSIPNVRNTISHEFKVDDVVALEPFVTGANGYAKETGINEIFRYLQDKSVRMPEGRQILAMARDDFGQLPFAKRWLLKKFSPVKVSLALRQLEAVGAIEPYPALRESGNRAVSQAEHTLIVTESGNRVTTRSSE